jgi:transcriptional regulator with XRE-family HTH domain
MGEPVVAGDVVDQVGEEIRRLRRSRGMSIAQLAQRIGRSIGFVSQIERGMSRPTVKDLYAISVGLGVQIGWFMLDKAPAPERERGVVVRAGNRRGYQSAGIATEALSPYLGEELEMMLSTVQPGAGFEEKVSAHKGREAGFILKGQLEMWIGGVRHLLNEGDSYTFLSSTPHWSRNPGETETVFVWVVTPASAGRQ